jgi:hypothetical protein
MAGLRKAWKANSRLPTLSTNPLEISPKAGEIPTFPQLGGSGMEKGKTKNRFPTFPFRFATTTTTRSPSNTGRQRASPPPPQSYLQFDRKEPAADRPHLEISGSSRIGMKSQFQAHLALESNFDFRLISGLENAACYETCARQRDKSPALSPWSD